MRWLYRGLVLLGTLLIVLNGFLILTGEGSGSTWLQLVVWVVLTPMYAVMTRLQRRTLRRVQRSVDLNRAAVQHESDSDMPSER
jgi:membrane protein implicated in regulation of membrane protease activity